mgnify:CR=1 FL=1
MNETTELTELIAMLTRENQQQRELIERRSSGNDGRELEIHPTAAALAISHQLAPRLAAALVGYGILLSLATLPMWAWVVGRLAA